jgi:hypothetical protein
MRAIRSLLALAMFAVSLPVGNSQTDKDDAKALQGAWLLTELIVGGNKVPDKEFKGTTFVFAGDKLSIVPPNKDAAANAHLIAFALVSRFPVVPEALFVVDRRTFSFKLDPKQKPAAVDLTALDGDAKGVVSPGIYEVAGDTLRWCQSDDEMNTQRPRAFASPDKSRMYLFTFKRIKQ